MHIDFMCLPHRFHVSNETKEKNAASNVKDIVNRDDHHTIQGMNCSIFIAIVAKVWAEFRACICALCVCVINFVADTSITGFVKFTFLCVPSESHLNLNAKQTG